jgi:glutathione reductase (NADPH)
LTFPKETVLTDDFDLIVIGAGSGGVAASRRAAAHGARVLIAEADRVGGTCVMRGCVPKKLMMYAAGFSRELHEAEGFAWTGVAGRFEMARWADAKERELDRLEGIYRTMLAESGVELAPGRARLVAPDTVAVGHRKLRANGRSRDRAGPGGRIDLRRHQTRLRPYGGGAPDRGRGVRADA